MPIKINYVIATYNGIIKLKIPKNNVLHKHLQCLNSLKHNLCQITIMKAYDEDKTNKKYYDDYYNCDDIIKELSNKCKIVDHDIPNKFISFGQWFQCYNIYRDNFDYYIFTEDDYVPNKDYFDTILTKIYLTKFADNVGMLSSILELDNLYKNIYPFGIYSGNVVVSTKTLHKLFDEYNMYNRVYQVYDKIYKHIKKSFIKIDRDGKIIKPKSQIFSGGCCQIGFTYIFAHIKIKLASTIDNYNFIYFDGSCYSIFLKKDKDIICNKKTNNICKNINDSDLIKLSLVLPVQLLKHKNYI